MVFLLFSFGIGPRIIHGIHGASRLPPALPRWSASRIKRLMRLLATATSRPCTGRLKATVGKGGTHGDLGDIYGGLELLKFERNWSKMWDIIMIYIMYEYVWPFAPNQISSETSLYKLFKDVGWFGIPLFELMEQCGFQQRNEDKMDEIWWLLCCKQQQVGISSRKE